MSEDQEQNRWVTLDDVAALAGVSKSSVSRALHGVPGAVSPATAQRVRKAAEELGYLPNAVAASLTRRKTRTVGLILPDLGNPFFASVAHGIESTFQPAGYRLLLSNTGGDAAREVEQTNLLLEHQVDGLLVVTSATSGEHLQRALERGVNLVFVDTYLTDPVVDRVLADNVGGGTNAVNHLLSLGHQEIGVIRGANTESAASDRVLGALGALHQHGLDLPPERVLVGDCAIAGGFAAAQSLIESPNPPTAIFVTNNLMTLGALRAIVDRGLRVPGDISLIGFDDMDWYPVADPPITAISQPAYEIGVRAAQRALGGMSSENPVAPETIVLPTELIVRESTAPLDPDRSSSPKADLREDL